MVSVVLDSLAEGHSVERILQAFPTMKLEDVHACIAYAAELAHDIVVPLPRSA